MVKKAEGFESESILVLPPYLVKEMEQHPIVRQLYITDIGYFPHAANHYRERPNGSASSIVIYCFQGAGWVSREGVGEYRLRAGDLTIIPAGEPHAYGANEEEPWSIYWFHFLGELSASYLQSLDFGNGPLQLTTSDSEKFISHFRQMFDGLTNKSYSVPHLIHVSMTAGYLFSLLGLIPGRTRAESKLHAIDIALRIMTERLGETLTLARLSRDARVSKQHLNHLFKITTGFAPIDYFNRMKMNRACQLLDLSDLSVKEVCHELGFKDPYYFSRLFKKIVGQSPSGYRGEQKG